MADNTYMKLLVCKYIDIIMKKSLIPWQKYNVNN